jgi:hypothetical protein
MDKQSFDLNTLFTVRQDRTNKNPSRKHDSRLVSALHLILRNNPRHICHRYLIMSFEGKEIIHIFYKNIKHNLVLILLNFQINNL